MSIMTHFLNVCILVVSRPSPAHWSVATYSLSSVVLFRAILFAGVPYVPSVAQIPQRVVGVSLCQILLQVVIVLDSLFLHRIGAVFSLEFLYQLGKVLGWVIL